MNGFTFTQDADDPAIFAAVDRRRRRVMGGPARLLALLAVAAATQGSRRLPIGSCPPIRISWWPMCGRRSPTSSCVCCSLAWRANPIRRTESVALAAAYIERARSLREPAYFGRAEAVLAPLRIEARRQRLRCAACTPKYCSIGTTSRPPKLCSMRCCARLLTISRRACCAPRCAWCVAILPVRARDCAQLAVAGGKWRHLGVSPASPRRSPVRAISSRARALLDSAPAQPEADSLAHAYLLATRAELRERGRDLERRDRSTTREALKLAPRDDSIRAALADALAARGDVGDARELLAIEKPSLALLVRSAALSEGARRASLSARANGVARPRSRSRRCDSLSRSGVARAGQ